MNDTDIHRGLVEEMKALSEKYQILGYARFVTKAQQEGVNGTFHELALAAKSALAVDPEKQVFIDPTKAGGAMAASFKNEIWVIDVFDFST